MNIVSEIECIQALCIRPLDLQQGLRWWSHD